MAGPNFVMVDLDFDNLDEADTFLVWLRDLWEGPGKAVMQNPEAWTVETIETAEPDRRRPAAPGGGRVRA